MRSFGIQRPCGDPMITLYSGSVPIASNDNWERQLSAEFAQAGAFPFLSDSTESAMIVTLVAGAYTAVITCPPGREGVSLFEIFDLDQGPGKLVNVSILGFAGLGEESLAPGVVLRGVGRRFVMFRAVGPSLGLPPFGLPNVLSDPIMRVEDSIAGVRVYDDNDFDPSVFDRVGAFRLPVRSKDAVFGGHYQWGSLPGILPMVTISADIRGAGGTTGMCLVEVYVVAELFPQRL